MRTILRILAFLAFLLPAFGRAQSSNQFIVATAVVTNTPSTNDTFSVNGHVRYWIALSNYVSAATNIATTNSANASATNLYNAYTLYPELSPFVTATFSSSNTVVFTGAMGAAVVLATNSATVWVTWSYVTNSSTNAYALLYPATSITPTLLTNEANGVVGILDASANTNPLVYPVGISAAGGFSSGTTNHGSIAASGYTNTNGLTIWGYVTATGSITNKDGAGNAWITNAAATNLPFILQTNAAITTSGGSGYWHSQP